MLDFLIHASKLEYVSEITHKFVNGYKSLPPSLTHSVTPLFIHSSPCRGCFGDSLRKQVTYMGRKGERVRGRGGEGGEGGWREGGGG